MPPKRKLSRRPAQPSEIDRCRQFDRLAGDPRRPRRLIIAIAGASGALTALSLLQDGSAMAWLGTEGKKAGVDVQSFWDDIARVSCAAAGEREAQARHRSRLRRRTGRGRTEERERRRLAAWQAVRCTMRPRPTEVGWHCRALATELSDTATALQSQARLGATRKRPLRHRRRLDVVQWYLFFIDVSRSAPSRRGSTFCATAPTGYPATPTVPPRLRWWRSTVDGAYALRGHLTSQADAIRFAGAAQRLRRAVEREPSARAFKRPGFD